MMKMRYLLTFLAVLMAALISNASALHIEAGELNVNGGSGDGLGNSASSAIHATYATADVGTFYGAAASASNYGTLTTNGGSIETSSDAWSTGGQHSHACARITDGYGTLNVNQGAAAGDGWAEAGQTTSVDLYSGWGGAGAYADDQGYNSAGATSTVASIGTISTNQVSHASFGNLYSNQESTVSVGLGGWASAYSDAQDSAGHNSHVRLDVYDSGGFWSGQGSGAYYGDGASTSAGQATEASNGEEGGSVYVSARSNDNWNYPGNVNIDANVQNGYISASLFSQSDDYTALSGGNIGGMAGSYGWIGLNAYAYGGANSNKNAEFWNGYADSGVTAGTDGLSAWTAWEAPVVDFLPCV
jgi:hypothetical protein